MYARQFKSGFWLAVDSLKMIWRHKKLWGFGVIAALRILFATIGFLIAFRLTSSFFGVFIFVMIGIGILIF